MKEQDELTFSAEKPQRSKVRSFNAVVSYEQPYVRAELLQRRPALRLARPPRRKTQTHEGHAPPALDT